MPRASSSPACGRVAPHVATLTRRICSRPRDTPRVPLRELAIDNIPLSAVISGYAIGYSCMRRHRLQRNDKLGRHIQFATAMRLDRAFPLDDPAVSIPWRISESAFRKLVPDKLEQVAAGRLRRRCRLLGGLDADLMFHFSPPPREQLREIELLRYPSR